MDIPVFHRSHASQNRKPTVDLRIPILGGFVHFPVGLLFAFHRGSVVVRGTDMGFDKVRLFEEI